MRNVRKSRRPRAFNGFRYKDLKDKKSLVGKIPIRDSVSDFFEKFELDRFGRENVYKRKVP